MYLLQCHKTVSIEALATLMPYPIKFESRRRNIQRFLNLESLKIETLWFPLIEIILKEKFKPKQPCGIEAMFKDCKTGGYNLEKTQASEHRLNSLILLIALAYSCAILQGQQIKRKGIQNYVGRLKEFRRSLRRHSSFWIGLYGQSWVIGMEFFQEIVNELMLIRRNKLPFFQRGLRAMSLILSTF